METTIPFQGFYYSLHEAQIDSAIDSIVMIDNCDVIDSLRELISDNVDYQSVFNGYAAKYIDWIKSEFNLNIQYSFLSSPKCYNFETDRIICNIELNEVQRVFDSVYKNKLDARIKERFTSRSGFISFYENSLEAWPKNLEEWDLNQVGTLIDVYLEHEKNNNTSLDELFYYNAHAICFNIISEYCNRDVYSRINKIREYLNARNNRK
jgi:hypothetical protein